MKFKMVTYPDGLLRMKSEPVTDFGPKLKALSDAMLDSLESLHGVGLSAVQIGKLIRLFVVDTRIPGERAAFVNPQIIETSQDNVPYDEGCLSVPTFFANVMRPSEVVVQAFDTDGKPFTLHASGLYARAIQHEADHLDGKLFIDHLDEKDRKALLKEYDRAFGKSGVSRRKHAGKSAGKR